MRYLIFLFSLIASAQVTTHSATLTWEDLLNPSGTTYSVLRASGLCSGTPTYSTIATALTVKTYVDTTVTPGNYCYVVTATYNGVTSSPSNTAGAPIPSFAPTKLSLTIAKIEVKVPEKAS